MTDQLDDVRPALNAKLSPVGWFRFVWRQWTSMRTALFLLLMLALAAIPGSLVPQRSADPNGVIQYRRDNPELFAVLDALQLFDTYASVWFSAIYLLLFVSLVGCLVPRTKHHLEALRSRPPKTPARLDRLAAFEQAPISESAPTVDAVMATLRRRRYRVERYGSSISAERGYLREAGNLVFHAALVGVLVAVWVGGGYGYVGQKVVVEGESFPNVRAAYDMFKPGRFFVETQLSPISLTLSSFSVDYESENLAAFGQPLDFVANVSLSGPNLAETQRRIRVNEPLSVDGTQIYLLGNGYAPVITIRDPSGIVVTSQPVACRPTDSNMTSVCVLKVPDGLAEQVGFIGFFYPTVGVLESGAYTSVYPDLTAPLLTLEAYTGDLRFDDGVYALDTSNLDQIAGRDAADPTIELQVGQQVPLPGGLGTIELAEVPRFAAFDFARNPGQTWVLAFASLAVAGLLAGLFIPRRRIWVKWTDTTLQFAGLSRGEDVRLIDEVHAIRTAILPLEKEQP